MAKPRKFYTPSVQTSRDLSTNMTFKYVRGEVKLEFVLSLDKAGQARDFKECLETALKDVNQLLEDKPWKNE